EFAVVAPFVGVLIMGMCEMGRAVMVKETLTNAARKACRTGVMPGKTYQSIIDDATNILADNNISSTHVTITVQVATYSGTSTTTSWNSLTTVTSANSFKPGALDQVSVKIAIPIKDVLWFTPQFVPKTSVESETLIMLRQG